MRTINEIQQVLSLEKPSLCEIYQITEIGIFGSYARGDVPFGSAQRTVPFTHSNSEHFPNLGKWFIDICCAPT